MEKFYENVSLRTAGAVLGDTGMKFYKKYILETHFIDFVKVRLFIDIIFNILVTYIPFFERRFSYFYIRHDNEIYLF